MKSVYYYLPFFLFVMYSTLFASSSQKESMLSYEKETHKQGNPSGFYLGANVGVNTIFNIHSIRQYVSQAGAGVNYIGKTSFV